MSQEPVEVERMLSAEEREMLYRNTVNSAKFSTEAYFTLKGVLKSHDICERALREALASSEVLKSAIGIITDQITLVDGNFHHASSCKAHDYCECTCGITEAIQFAKRVADIEAERDAALARNQELEALLNTPEIEVFDRAVPLEAAHQVSRWTAAHDADKNPEDWFWLVGYLAGKALSAMKSGNAEKAKHHCISTAAALRNWHSHIRSGASAMRPGIAEPEALAHQPSEQAAETKCKWCEQGKPIVYPGFGNGKPYHAMHETEYEPGEPFEPCTTGQAADPQPQTAPSGEGKGQS